MGVGEGSLARWHDKREKLITKKYLIEEALGPLTTLLQDAGSLAPDKLEEIKASFERKSREMADIKNSIIVVDNQIEITKAKVLSKISMLRHSIYMQKKELVLLEQFASANGFNHKENVAEAGQKV